MAIVPHSISYRVFLTRSRISRAFARARILTNIYLVDPASSHMLVSKIKPCMSKYGSSTVKLRMAH